MKKEMLLRGSRIALFATVMFTGATLFATLPDQSAAAADAGGNLIQPVTDNVGGDHINDAATDKVTSAPFFGTSPAKAAQIAAAGDGSGNLIQPVTDNVGGDHINDAKTVMSTSATLFGTMPAQAAAAANSGGNLIQPVTDNVGGDHFIPVQPVNNNADPDGTWIFNTNSTVQPWSTSADWAGGVIADGGGKADFSTLNISGARAVQVDSARTVGRLDIGDTDGGQSYTITAAAGVSLTFDNTANSADAQLNETAGSHGDTISVPMILNSSLDISNASANTLTLSSSTISDGNISAAVKYSGTGTFALSSAANTYTGGTTIAGGKVTIAGSGTPLGNGPLTLSGGTLTSSASRSSTATNVILTADSALTTTSTAANPIMPFSGTLTGTGGTLTIRNDASSTTGVFDVRFSGGDYTMSRPIDVENGSGGGTARLNDFNAAGTTHTYSGVISGNGGYNRSISSGTGGLTIFLADNTYTGSTTVFSGTLQLGNGGTTGSLSPSSAISIATAGTLRFDHTSGADFVQGTNFSSAAITGAGKIIKDGTSSLTFNVANSFSGGITINNGTVVSAVDGALGTGNISLTAGNITLTLNGASNNIADTATLSFVNTDTINLNNTSTDVVAGLIVDGVAQAAGTYGSGDFAEFAGTGTITVVPEPTTIGMLLLGGGLLSAVQRFRRKQI